MNDGIDTNQAPCQHVLPFWVGKVKKHRENQRTHYISVDTVYGSQELMRSLQINETAHQVLTDQAQIQRNNDQYDLSVTALNIMVVQNG